MEESKVWGILLCSLRDTDVLVNAQNLDRDHAANQVAEQGFLNIKLMFLPQVSLSVNESRPRSGQSTPTPSHEPFSYHKCIWRTQAVRPSTGPRGTLPFRTTRGRLPPLLLIAARPTRKSNKAVCASPRGAERRLILSNAACSRLCHPPASRGNVLPPPP